MHIAAVLALQKRTLPGLRRLHKTLERQAQGSLSSSGLSEGLAEGLAGMCLGIRFSVNIATCMCVYIYI